MSERQKLGVCGLVVAAVCGVSVAVIAHAWGLSDRQTFCLFVSHGLLISLVNPLGYVAGIVSKDPRP